MGETSDQENTTIANQEPMKDAHADDHKDMDDVDTDDLLDEAELSLKSTHWTASKTTTTSSRRKGKGATTTSTATTTTSRRRKGAKSTEDMDIDESESETGKRSTRRKAKGKQKVTSKCVFFGIHPNKGCYSQRWLNLIQITPKSWHKSTQIPIGSFMLMLDIK